MSQSPAFVSCSDVEPLHATTSFGEQRTIYQLVIDKEKGPDGYLVHMPPHTTTRAHFHRINQFQILFGAPGAIYQRHPIERPVVHYADPYTTYGPFGPGDEPMDFFTLRAKYEPYTGFMPEAREHLVGRPGRNIHVEVEPADDLTDAGPEPQCETLMEDGDGLLAELVTLGPGASIAGRDPSGTGGQYYCVIGGALQGEATRYEPKALLWVAPEDTPPTLTAAERGAQVVLMQFPSPPS